MIKTLVFINGIYDIICGLSLILNEKNPIKLHLNIFNDKFKNPLQKRLLGYWIFTYGIMRLFTNYEFTIIMSYLIEIFMFYLEGYIYKTCDKLSVNFIIFTSLLILSNL